MRIPDSWVSQFGGLNTFVKDRKTLKPGVATRSKNWVTAKFGDHIALRRGSALLGTTRVAGIGKITGLGVGIDYNGNAVPFWTRGRKIEYYNIATDDRAEVGSDLLSVAQDGKDCWIDKYQNLMGSMVFIGGRFTTTFKIPVANPDSAVDQSVNNHRFEFMRFGLGRSTAGRRNGTVAGNKDDTGFYLSDVDKGLLSLFTQVTAEAIGGSGSTTYTGTLTQRTGVRTVAHLAIKEATGETLLDQRDGTLLGDQGSTGTINYATGAYSVTFNHVTVGNVTADYYYEDSTADGVLDFDTASTGSGKAKVYRQDDGGPFMAAFPFLGVQYALHLLKTWNVTIPLNDTETTNLEYRAIGIKYPYSAAETPDGILVIDTANPSEPKVRRLQIRENAATVSVVPTPISDALDLTGFAFDRAIAFRWGDYDIVCCQEVVNGVANTHNSVMFIRNVFSGAWDQLAYNVSRLAVFDGALIAGDSISNNVYTLFSGFDDDEGSVDNYWEDGQDNLKTNNQKVANHMRVAGLIQPDQEIEVYLTLDDGPPVKVFTIEGDADYVDQGINTPIGSYTIGSKVIGGGGEATAHPFDVTFPVHTARFQYVTVGFKATEIGHAAINGYGFKDIRDKGTRSLPTKTVR